MVKYSRQELLKEIGKVGQGKLKTKKVAIVGAGALGSSSAELLARAGVGSLKIIDRDCVEESNLQRQTLYTEEDVGKSKVKAAKERLEKINSTAVVEDIAINLSNKNINQLDKADLILDCTDNLETRFLINDYCKKEKIPWVYAAAIRTAGFVLPIFPETACLSCFLKEASLETCDTVGVLNTITSAIAAMQSTLALKILLEEKVDSELNYFNIWQQEYKKIKVNKNPGCETCNGNFNYLNAENKLISKFCSSGKYQILGGKKEFAEIKEKWQKIGFVEDDGIVLRFKNIVLFKDGRALIKSNSEEEALSTYTKYLRN